MKNQTLLWRVGLFLLLWKPTWGASLYLSWLCNLIPWDLQDKSLSKDFNFSSKPDHCPSTEPCTFLPSSTGLAEWTKEELAKGMGTGRAYRFLVFLRHYSVFIPSILIFFASASLAPQCQWFWCHGSQTRSASLPIRSDKDKNNTRQPDNQKRQHKTIKQPQLHTSPSLENHSIWFLVLCSWLSQITRHSRPLTIVSPAFFHWICRLHLGGDQRIHEHCQQRQQQQQQQEQQ